MTNKEQLVFGHKDLTYKKYKSMRALANAVSLDLSICKIKLPWVSSSTNFVEIKNKISAQTYLDYSLKNIQENSESGFLDSISNSKRAIYRRYDEILIDLLSLNPQRKNKFLILAEDLGIYIPDLIKDFIIDPRNIFEHEYESPEKNTTQRAYEVAKLFLDSTKSVLDGLIKTIEFGLFEDKSGLQNMYQGFNMHFIKSTRKNGNHFLITYQEKGASGDHFILDNKHSNYNDLVFSAVNFSQTGKSGHTVKQLLCSC